MDGIISAAFQAVILLFAGTQIVQGKMTVGELTMVNSYFAMLLQCSKYYIGFYKQFQDALASYGRIGSLVATSTPYTGERELEHVSEIELSDLKHSIHQGGVERALWRTHLYLPSGDDVRGYGRERIRKEHAAQASRGTL